MLNQVSKVANQILAAHILVVGNNVLVVIFDDFLLENASLNDLASEQLHSVNKLRLPRIFSRQRVKEKAFICKQFDKFVQYFIFASLVRIVFPHFNGRNG